MRLIFIASLEHSGSTLLDLVLGGHPRIVGLGELYQLVRADSPHLQRADQVMCSCGKPMPHCDFWGPTLKQLRSHPVESPAQRYQRILDTAAAHFGPDTWLVDASKNLDALQFAARWQPFVLFLLRDVRSWTVSRQDERRRQELFTWPDLWRQSPYRAPIRLLTRSALWYFHQWHRGNRRIQAALETSGLSWFQLGYEELALYPEYMTGRIVEALNLPPATTMVEIAHSHSHSILGNRMRSQPEKRQRIFYDNRWFYRDDWWRAAGLMRWIMRYNQQHVYANTRDHLWRS